MKLKVIMMWLAVNDCWSLPKTTYPLLTSQVSMFLQLAIMSSTLNKPMCDMATTMESSNSGDSHQSQAEKKETTRRHTKRQTLDQREARMRRTEINFLYKREERILREEADSEEKKRLASVQYAEMVEKLEAQSRLQMERAEQYIRFLAKKYSVATPSNYSNSEL